MPDARQGGGTILLSGILKWFPAYMGPVWLPSKFTGPVWLPMEVYVIAFSIIIDMIIFLGFVCSVLTVSTYVSA